LAAAGVNAQFNCFGVMANDTACNRTNGCAATPPLCAQNATCPQTTNQTACEAQTDCKLSTSISDYATCTRDCQATCSGRTMATCASAGCQWLEPFCITASSCNLKMDKAGCTGDATGCVWFSYTETSCGGTTTNGVCAACDDAQLGPLRGILARKAGQTCTWPIPTGQQAFSLKVNEATSGATCTAAPAEMATDMATLTAAVNAQFSGAIVAGSNATCTGGGGGGSSGSSLLSPSVGVLVALAFLGGR